MRLMRKKLGLALCLAGLSLGQSGLAAVSAAASGATDLRSATELAWQRHPQAAALDARDQQARAAQELAAGLTPEPASLSIGSRNDRYNNNLGQQEYELELAVPLWLPGQKTARSAEAQARVDEALSRRAALRWEIAGTVREAWWSLAAARNAQTLAVRRVDTAGALDKDIQRRYQLGDVSRIDANLARSELNLAQAELFESEVALSEAEQNFMLLSGTAAPVTLDQEQLSVGKSQRELIDAPLSHPLLAQAANAFSSAQARAKLAGQTQRAAPELALRMQRERGASDQPYANSIGLSLKIPFSSGAQNRELNAGAQADSLQAEAELLQLKNKVQLNLEQLLRQQQAQQRQLAIAGQSHALSMDNLQLAEKAFQLGESDLSSLLRLRATAYQAEAQLQRQRLAGAALISKINQAMGVLP